MRCPSDGQWRRDLDIHREGAGEGQADTPPALAAHLAACPRCRQRRARLAANAQLAAQLAPASAALEAGPTPAVPAAGADTAAALAAVLRRAARPVPPPPRRGWLWAPAAVAAAVLILALAPGARSWAANVLSMLRIRHVTVVAVNPPTLPAASQQQVRSLVQQMISQRVVVTIHSGPPRLAASGQQASQWAGFAVRLPTGVAAPAQIAVTGQRAFQMTLDRDRLDTILAAAGRSDLQLPPSADGALVAVNIPASVRAAYGQCAAKPVPAGGCTVLSEVPSPVISVPPSLNLSALAQIGLQAAGMSAQEAAAFCQTVNWRSTLVLPVPEAESTYNQIPVDGVQGIVVRFAPHGSMPPRYVLSWVRDGVIYSIRGQGPAATGIALAEALP